MAWFGGKTEEKIQSKPAALTTEGILHDVLPEIFKYLNTRDLCKAAGVCSSWNKAVQLELSKRSIQSLSIKAVDYLRGDVSNHINNYLRNKPRHCFIFFEDLSPRYNDITRYSSILPVSSCTVIETLGASIDKTPVLGMYCNALGIFIPEHSSIKIKIQVPHHSVVRDYPECNPILSTEVLEGIINHSQDHNCIIIFNLVSRNNDESFAALMRRFSQNILRDLRERYKPGKFSLWGGSVRSIKTSGCNVSSKSESCWFGMSLTGPTLRSYSIAISVDLPESEKEEKLKKFKLSVNTKTKTVAFAFVPIHKSLPIDYRISRTEAFRKVFPKLTLTIVYNTQKLEQYSIDTSNTDPDPQLEFRNCVAYLIISHS